MTGKARNQEAEPDPLLSNFERNLSQKSSEVEGTRWVEYCQDRNEQLNTTPRSPAVLRRRRDATRVRGILPPVGRMIEVLWDISPEDGEEQDEDWQSAREESKDSRIWWPAKILEGADDQSRSLQYTRSAYSRNHLDLDPEIHKGIIFYSNGELQHSLGRFARMFGEWRFCAWKFSKHSQPGVHRSCSEILENDIDHDECRSALLQLADRVRCVETKLDSLRSISSGLSQVHPTVTAEFKLQVVVDRIKALLQTHIFAMLQPVRSKAKARRTRTIQSLSSSEHELVKDGVLRSQEVDCTLSEFQQLALGCRELCGEGVEVRPSFFKTSFLNFRSKEALRIVFRSLHMLCKAIGVNGHNVEDLVCQVTAYEAFHPSKVSVVGFSITRTSGGASESVMLPALGSTWLGAPSCEDVAVLHRPLAGWNSRDSCFGSDYQIRTLSVRELQHRYSEAFQAKTSWGIHTGKNGIVSQAHGQIDQGSIQSKLGPDFEDFAITIEWNRKDGQILSAFSAVSSEHDILGSLVCSIPCIEVTTIALCQNIIGLLASMKSSETGLTT